MQFTVFNVDPLVSAMSSRSLPDAAPAVFLPNKKGQPILAARFR
jgi:hypothetical protein